MNNEDDKIFNEFLEKIPNLIAQGYTDLPPLNFRCGSCGLISYMKTIPKAKTFYQCNNCMIVMYITEVTETKHSFDIRYKYISKSKQHLIPEQIRKLLK